MKIDIDDDALREVGEIGTKNNGEIEIGNGWTEIIKDGLGYDILLAPDPAMSYTTTVKIGTKNKFSIHLSIANEFELPVRLSQFSELMHEMGHVTLNTFSRIKPLSDKYKGVVDPKFIKVAINIIDDVKIDSYDAAMFGGIYNAYEVMLAKLIKSFFPGAYNASEKLFKTVKGKLNIDLMASLAVTALVDYAIPRYYYYDGIRAIEVHIARKSSVLKGVAESKFANLRSTLEQYIDLYDIVEVTNNDIDKVMTAYERVVVGLASFLKDYSNGKNGKQESQEGKSGENSSENNSDSSSSEGNGKSSDKSEDSKGDGSSGKEAKSEQGGEGGKESKIAYNGGIICDIGDESEIDSKEETTEEQNKDIEGQPGGFHTGGGRGGEMTSLLVSMEEMPLKKELRKALEVARMGVKISKHKSSGENFVTRKYISVIANGTGQPFKARERESIHGTKWYFLLDVSGSTFSRWESRRVENSIGESTVLAMEMKIMHELTKMLPDDAVVESATFTDGYVPTRKGGKRKFTPRRHTPAFINTALSRNLGGGTEWDEDVVKHLWEHITQGYECVILTDGEIGYPQKMRPLIQKMFSNIRNKPLLFFVYSNYGWSAGSDYVPSIASEFNLEAGKDYALISEHSDATAVYKYLVSIMSKYSGR